MHRHDVAARDLSIRRARYRIEAERAVPSSLDRDRMPAEPALTERRSRSRARDGTRASVAAHHPFSAIRCDAREDADVDQDQLLRGSAGAARVRATVSRTRTQAVAGPPVTDTPGSPGRHAGACPHRPRRGRRRRPGRLPAGFKFTLETITRRYDQREWRRVETRSTSVRSTPRSRGTAARLGVALQHRVRRWRPRHELGRVSPAARFQPRRARRGRRCCSCAAVAVAVDIGAAMVLPVAPVRIARAPAAHRADLTTAVQGCRSWLTSRAFCQFRLTGRGPGDGAGRGGHRTTTRRSGWRRCWRCGGCWISSRPCR